MTIAVRLFGTTRRLSNTGTPGRWEGEIPDGSTVEDLIAAVGSSRREVTSVAIDEDSVNDPSVSSCIKGYARRWRFPPPEGGSAEVAVPFNFKAAQ